MTTNTKNKLPSHIRKMQEDMARDRERGVIGRILLPDGIEIRSALEDGYVFENRPHVSEEEAIDKAKELCKTTAREVYICEVVRCIKVRRGEPVVERGPNRES
jgi:hypothetical protein